MSDAALGTGSDKCAWCARRDGDLIQLRLRVPGQLALNLFWTEVHVHPRHEHHVRRWFALFRRDGRKFVISMLVFVVFLPTAALTVASAAGVPVEAAGEWGEKYALGPYLIVFGTIIAVWPFATPLTTRLFGMRASIVLVRVAALVIGVWGLARLVVLVM